MGAPLNTIRWRYAFVAPAFYMQALRDGLCVTPYPYVGPLELYV